MSPLLAIPLELLVEISSYLTTPDFASLRLTCTTIERSLWDWFAEEFFAKKQFMITWPSLQALVDISHHDRLSKTLKHVIISTLLFRPDADPDPSMPQFADNIEADLVYADVVASQRALIQHDSHRDMLVEAFKGLEHLETIDMRDFNAGRPRDRIRWNSWGARTVHFETGRQPSTGPYRLSEEIVGQLFSTLLYALGLAERRIPRMVVPLRNYKRMLPDGSFYLSDAFFPAVEPVLLNLDVLHLAVSMEAHGVIWPPRNDALSAHHSRCLRHFLSCTSKLKELRLNFEHNAREYNDSFMQWLAAPSVVSLDTPCPTKSLIEGTMPIKLPRLVTLEIGQLEIGPSLLLSVISKFAPTLERIALRHIALTPDASMDADKHARLWTQFVDDLALIPLPSLTYFSLGDPTIVYDHSRRRRRRELGVYGRKTFMEHSGRDMPDFFRKLAQHPQKLVVQEDNVRHSAPRRYS